MASFFTSSPTRRLDIQPKFRIDVCRNETSSYVNQKHRAVSIALAALVLCSYLWWYFRWYPTMQLPEKNLYEIAPLIDGHNDFPIWIRAFYHNHIYQRNFSANTELSGQVDFPRLKQSHLGGQFWSVYVECRTHTSSPQQPGNHSDETYREIIHDTLQQIDLVHRLFKEFPSHLVQAPSAADIRRTFNARGHHHKIVSLMGIEGLHQIGNSASILRIYHALGVRYATLTHTCHNVYADSEEPAAPQHGGLSDAGTALVHEMNRLGMIVDLSHTSLQTQMDVLAVAAAPVLFSHSNALGRCNSTRNVPDDILHSVKQNGGVVMVTFYPSFLEEDTVTASLGSAADYIQYIGEMIGYRHVGIGSDFDGMPAGPEGLEDVSKYPDLIHELLSRGITQEKVHWVMGLNVIRVLEQVEAVAESMKDVRPLEDDVKQLLEY